MTFVLKSKFKLKVEKMNIWFSLLISLLLTSMVSFIVPTVICGLILITLAMASHLPEFSIFWETCYNGVWNFLMTFGNGSGSEGILTIGLTCGCVGCLFEALNFYRYQTLINQSFIIKNQDN